MAARDLIRERDRTLTIIVRAEAYETQDGAYRVTLKCRTKEGGRTLKDFLSHRILGITDAETGEIVSDIPSYLSQVIVEAEGQQPRYWPRPDTDPIRTTSLDIEFDPDGHAVGWVFGVHVAFRSSLDILCHEDGATHRKVWTQGIPPHYDFDVGDIFYSPFPWGAETLFVIQVQEVDDQEITVTVSKRASGKTVEASTHTMTQTQLAQVLRFGLTALPKTSDTPPEAEPDMAPEEARI